MNYIVGLPSSSKSNSLFKELRINDYAERYSSIGSEYNLNEYETASLIWSILVSRYDYLNEIHFAFKVNGGIRKLDSEIPVDEVDKLCQIIKDSSYDETEQYYLTYGERETNSISFSVEDGDLIICIDLPGSSINLDIVESIDCNIKCIIDNLCDKNISLCDYVFGLDREREYFNQINGKASDPSAFRPISHMVEEQAKKTPESIAIYYDDSEYTYQELNQRSNYLAKQLFEFGIRKGQYVLVYMNRSVELIAAILSVMKVGGVFVPIDLKWPIDRVRLVAENTGARVVIVDDEHKNTFSNELVISWDTLPKQIDNIDYGVTANDNIYAIFTSGSTGIPKGAINKHCGIANRFLYMNKRYSITSKDVILMTSNHAFDSSVWQMFWPLINGNATVIPKLKSNIDIVEIMKLIQKYKVTITDFVPSVFNLMVDFIRLKPRYRDNLTSLRQLLIGGEEMNPSYIYYFKSLFPLCSITNTYGPAEASIGTVFYELPKEKIDRIPIGKPIDNVKTFILDYQGRIMPIGAIGMLYLGGICVGSGYVGDVQATKEVFTDREIFGITEHIYRTGDIVSINEDGDIDFWGRKDSQVKINGVRIELDEIEKAIQSIGIVDKCCVVCKQNKSKKAIVAFVVTDKSDAEDNIRRELLKNLPKAMLPHQIVRIDEMPINSNGKTDIKALKGMIEL